MIGNSRLSALSAQSRGQRRPTHSRSMRAQLAEEARFDGIFVLRTNAKVTPSSGEFLRYRDLLLVEDLFRRTKAIMTAPEADLPFLRRRHPRPCLLLISWRSRCKSVLDDLLRQTGLVPEWKDLLRDLDRLAQARIRHREADWLVRTDAAPYRDHAVQECPHPPCRRAPSRRPRRHRPGPNPLETAAAAPGVVPRQVEFRRNANRQSIHCKNQVFKPGLRFHSACWFMSFKINCPGRYDG